MTTKRLLLLAVAAAFAWYVFIRKKAPAGTTMIVRPANAAGAGNAAVAKTINTVSNAAQPALAQITGTLLNGVVTSLKQYGQGGSSGADTGSTSQWGDFQNNGASGYGAGTGYNSDITTSDYVDSSVSDYAGMGGIN